MISAADIVLLTGFIAEDKALTDQQINGVLQAKPDRDGDGQVTMLDITVLLCKVNKP